MSKIFRIIIVVVVLGLVALVSNQVVQAGWALGTPNEAPKVVPPAQQNDTQASEPSDTQPQAMGEQGTIRPPGCNKVDITTSGEYSVCGIAVVSVGPKPDNVEITLKVGPLPKDAGNVLAGSVILQCWVDGKKDQGPHDQHGNPQICFAAPPDKQVQVKFYDENTKSWVVVETTVANGRACAPATYSGKYILAEK